MDADVIALDTDSLAHVPTADLKSALADSIGVTAKSLSRMAIIWAELERRGEDLSHLRSGLLAYMPAIADGRLDPELVVRGAGQATMLKMAAELPISEQRRLLTEGATIVEATADGGISQQSIPVERLTISHVRKAFAHGRMRPPAEQMQLIRSSAPPASPERSKIVEVRLTPAEYRRVADLARSAGKRVGTYLRDVALPG